MEKHLMETLEERARANPKRIAFPEWDNEMILQAAQEVSRRKVGFPVVVGNPSQVMQAAEAVGVDIEHFAFFDYTDEGKREELAARYSRRFDDLSDKAVRRKAKNPLNCAMLLAKLGEVDCVAAGRAYTTADVLVSAQQIIGLEEGFETISSMGIVNIPGFEGPEGNMLGIADCAVNPLPDARGLADIALASADTVSALLGWEPRVAMLSFSTDGSGEHESIEPIQQAIGLIRERRPDLKIDGEFQLDTALLPQVAEKKLKRESDVAGNANVLIFPNLHAGNIGVKLMQIFGKADAYGPILQGFSVPVCDFSRGAPLSEMMGNIIMLIVRAGMK